MRPQHRSTAGDAEAERPECGGGKEELEALKKQMKKVVDNAELM